MGMALEGFGLPRMAGRVFGALLVADPAEQTAEDLAATLQASRGGISGATTLLETMGLIDRIRKPGDRKDYFRNKPNAWYEAMKKEIMMMSYLRQLADKGLELVQGANEEVTRGLTEMRDMISFFEREMPPLFTRWEEERNV
ncbi:MAG: MarR family transcriptional regulator [Trueperaceae bacterium]|nr:MarR family transcriptional regulator [Trueperaceae bacterium]